MRACGRPSRRRAPHLRHVRRALPDRPAPVFTKEWAGDEERRELTGVPDELCFATKPQLAAHMLRAACLQGISASFFLGDEAHGGRDLRTACRELGLGYVVGVRSNHQVTTPAAKLSAAKAAVRLPKRAWQRMRTGAGQKGVRDYDWALIEVTLPATRPADRAAADALPPDRPRNGAGSQAARTGP
ncbi:transposase [Streptomyces sp. NBC_01384]|uniref:transposase n=1 Tax=Streptomyces sp. NBC_01384 TaxID=2903847 RepID=UPI0038669321